VVKEKQKMAFSKKPDKPRKDEVHFTTTPAGDDELISTSQKVPILMFFCDIISPLS
jgi:hypothetical protein